MSETTKIEERQSDKGLSLNGAGAFLVASCVADNSLCVVPGLNQEQAPLSTSIGDAYYDLNFKCSHFSRALPITLLNGNLGGEDE
jgi:hypothetical protein